MTTSIEIRTDGILITVINGDNTIYSNVELSKLSFIELDTTLTTTIIITPQQYRYLPYAPKLTYEHNGTQAITKTFTKKNDTYELTLNFEQTLIPTYDLIIYSYTQEIYAILNLNLTNCICNYQEGKIEAQKSLTFNLTCASDYEFQIIPRVDYGTAYEHESGKQNTRTFTKIDDTSFSITLTTAGNRIYKVYAEAVKKSAISDKYGLISIYRLSNDDLHELVIKRFVTPELKPVQIDGVTVLYNVNYEYIDTAKYIVALHKLNIHIETTIKQRVYFGLYDMDIDCDIIENDIITLDFGCVRIQGIYNNSIDYEHTEITIYLPFVGFLSLNVNDFMNKVINLKYQVNILNGDSLILIYADNNLVMSHSCNIAQKIPYRMSDGEEINTQLDLNTNYLHNEQPFITTRTNKPVNNDTLPYHDTNYYAILGTLSGYTEATELALNIVHDFITLSEIEEIKSLVNKGVII